ncbi:MAG: peptidylprolyl isomerase, partial [Verrucomicrobiota bacterium]
MTHTGKFPLRPAIYGLVMIYLICDLYWCGGPLSRRINKSDPLSPVTRVAADPIVARVSAYNIHRSQLYRAVVERLRSEGKPLAGLNPAERSRVRYAALDDLIDHELLRTQAAAQASTLKVSDEEISERLTRFRARFSNNKELAAAMTSQGIGSEQDLRERLAARIQQEKFVEARIAPRVKVTQAEARQWFEQNQQRLTIPARVNARHIFIPTLERDPAAAKQPLVTALTSLTEKTATFATLARELSEDALTKDGGGELGWMTRERLPADLAEP